MNNNGHLSPNQSYSAYSPITLPFEIPLIAVLWADVDTRPRNGGYVWYRITNSSDLLQRARQDIQRAYAFANESEINYLLIATWDHVGYFPRQIDKVKMFGSPKMVHVGIVSMKLKALEVVWI